MQQEKIHMFLYAEPFHRKLYITHYFQEMKHCNRIFGLTSKKGCQYHD